MRILIVSAHSKEIINYWNETLLISYFQNALLKKLPQTKLVLSTIAIIQKKAGTFKQLAYFQNLWIEDDLSLMEAIKEKKKKGRSSSFKRETKK